MLKTGIIILKISRVFLMEFLQNTQLYISEQIPVSQEAKYTKCQS